MDQTDTTRVEELLTRYQPILPSCLQDLPNIFKRYPSLTIFMLIFGIISSVPFLLFIMFALSSFIFLLIGFLLVEGTLLAFATCILLPALFFATVAAIGISATFFIVGFTFSNWRQLVKECGDYIDTQLKIYQREQVSEKT